MDYDLAVMTWVAEQGKYGQFASAQPVTRFKMLAAVFDLAKYGPLHRAAQEKLRGAKERAAVAEGRVTELNDGLIDDDAQDDGAPTDAQLADAAAAAHTTLNDAATALAIHLQSDPQVAVERARAAHGAVQGARLERLAAAEQALVDARDARDKAPVRRDALVARARTVFERDLASAGSRAAASIGVVEGRIAAAESELAGFTEAAAAAPALRVAYQDYETAVGPAEQAGEAARAAVTAHELAVARAQDELRAAQSAVGDAVDALDALAHAGDCYACGQHISAQVVATLRASQQAAITAAEVEVAHASERVEAADAALTHAGEEWERARRTWNDIQVSGNQTSRNLAAAERAAADLERARETLAHEQERAERLRAELDETAARLAEERDAAIRAAEAEHDETLAAVTERGKSAAAAVNAARKPSADEERLALDLAQAEELAVQASEHAAITARLTEARDQARAEATRLDAEVGRRAEIARRQSEQGARIAAAKGDLDAARTDVVVYTDLVAAYAPGGIPSMILDSVIGDLTTRSTSPSASCLPGSWKSG